MKDRPLIKDQRNDRQLFISNDTNQENIFLEYNAVDKEITNYEFVKRRSSSNSEITATATKQRKIEKKTRK